MTIDLEQLGAIVLQKSDQQNVSFTGLDVSGTTDDLDRLVLDLAKHFNRETAGHEPQRIELTQLGHIDLYVLANFLSALPGKDDSDID